MTNLAHSFKFMRPPLDPLPREIVQLVWLAKAGHLKGQLETERGTIADLRGFVIDYALAYVMDADSEHALECLQLASETYAKNGLHTAEEPEEDSEHKAWPIPFGAVFRPCQEKDCRTPITFIVTRIDAHGNPVKLPVTKDGRSHYETCTNPKRFSQSSKAKAV